MELVYSKVAKKITLFLLIFSLLIIQIISVSATEVNVVNSKNWDDVYSMLLYSSLKDEPAFFVNSESITSLTKQLPAKSEVNLYVSKDNPYIPNIRGQLISAGFTINSEKSLSNFNTELENTQSNFLLVSADNFRLTIPAAPFAKNNGYWVYIVNENNIGDITSRIQNANNVIALGNFRRDFEAQLAPYVDEKIANDNIYLDSQEIAKKMPSLSNVILADGSLIEAEFFTTKNPVLLSGYNKLIDDTFSFLTNNGVEAVVIVGNKLAVIGEQIREKSDKKIGVFVKFGQSVIGNNDKIYALPMFPMPEQVVDLTINRVIYSPKTKELVVYYENTGNTALYELSTITIKNGKDEELVSVADDEKIFLGAGEVLPVIYSADIPVEDLTNKSYAEFYTSYGKSASEFDSFLTMKDKYSPPYRSPIEVKDIDSDNAVLSLVGAAYYSGLKRVGVEVSNDWIDTIYVRVKVNDLIINGLQKDVVGEGSVEPGKTKKIYIPAELDEVDQEENKAFNLDVVYGSAKDSMFKHISSEVPFTVEAGGLQALTGMVIGVFGGDVNPMNIALFLILLVTIGGAFAYVKFRKKTF